MLQVTEIYNFNQDDLMTEDIFILDCHSDIYVWVGQEVQPKNKIQALTIGEVNFCQILTIIYKLLSSMKTYLLVLISDLTLILSLGI